MKYLCPLAIPRACQRISHHNSRHPAEVPVGAPQLAHAMFPANGRHTGIMNRAAGDLSSRNHLFQLFPVASQLTQQPQGRRLQPDLHLFESLRNRRRGIIGQVAPFRELCTLRTLELLLE